MDIHAYDKALLADVGYDLEAGIRHAKTITKMSGKPVTASKILRMASGPTLLAAIPRAHVDAFKAVYCGEPWLKK
jgi:hypothetical protein